MSHLPGRSRFWLLSTSRLRMGEKVKIIFGYYSSNCDVISLTSKWFRTGRERLNNFQPFVICRLRWMNVIRSSVSLRRHVSRCTCSIWQRFCSAERKQNGYKLPNFVTYFEERNAVPDVTAAEENRKIRPMHINQEQRAISNECIGYPGHGTHCLKFCERYLRLNIWSSKWNDELHLKKGLDTSK